MSGTAAWLFVVDRYRQVRICLIGRHTKDLADPATARPAAAAWRIHIERCPVVPDDILAAIDLRSAATQHEIVASRMIDVDLAVPMRRILIGCAVIA